MQYLDILPETVLERILKELWNPVDLINCSLAHPRLKEELQRPTISRLLPQVLPLIVRTLGVEDTLKISSISDEWKDAVRNCDNHVPGRQPYDDRLLLHYMKTMGKDPGEHKWKTDCWFLKFYNGRDLRTFKSVLTKHPDKVPFAIGRSAYFEIRHSCYRVQHTYLFYLKGFLAKFGKHFRHVKLRFTKGYSLEHFGSFARIRSVLENTPNAVSVDIEGDFTQGWGSIELAREQVLMPHLPRLESLSLSLGMENLNQLEKMAVERHAKQLKTLLLTAHSGDLPKQMPCLLELHLQRIYSEEIFSDLKQLEAPLLQKLTLELLNSFCFCHVDRPELLEKIQHFPLRQLIIKWGHPTGHSNVHGYFSRSDAKLRKIQISSVHTLTIYNYPDNWQSLLVHFPCLTYLNIRITNPGVMSKDAKEIVRERDELRIKRILYGENEQFVKLPTGTDITNFLQLKQISVEMWEKYGNRGPGKLVHSKIWTRNPSMCFSLNDCIN